MLKTARGNVDFTGVSRATMWTKWVLPGAAAIPLLGSHLRQRAEEAILGHRGQEKPQVGCAGMCRDGGSHVGRLSG